ncbi:MAG: NAD(P)-dependent oxidoreductase, partial [Deltaproteobacteria bacterium]
GAEVAVLLRPATTNLWRIEDVLHHLYIIEGDLSDIERSRLAIQEFAPEVVFHLAWFGVANRHRNDIKQISCNLYGSINLLRLSCDSGCKRWVGLGSQAEYGIPEGILREDLPTRPVTLYGAVKLCVCILSQRLCEICNTDFAWLRLLASYGPMDDSEHLIPWVILKLLRGENPNLTLGEQRWDYLYVEDVVEALWQVAITPEAYGIFNLGSGKPHTIRSIVESIRDLINPNLPLGFGKVPYHHDQVMHLQADISRLQQTIAWSPQVSLDEGLRRTVEWFTRHQGRYAYA